MCQESHQIQFCKLLSLLVNGLECAIVVCLTVIFVYGLETSYNPSWCWFSWLAKLKCLDNDCVNIFSENRYFIYKKCSVGSLCNMSSISISWFSILSVMCNTLSLIFVRSASIGAVPMKTFLSRFFSRLVYNLGPM